MTRAELEARLSADTRPFRRDMRTADRSASRTAKSMSASFARAARSAAAVGVAASAAVAALVVGGSKVAKAGDRVTQSQAKIAASIGQTGNSAKVYERLRKITMDIGGNVRDTVGSFTRFNLAGQDIGATNDEMIRLTETILKLGVVGGATTTEISAGSMQLAQALASGRLAGDELRSVLENMPLVARQIAKGFGVSVGELRKMGEKGELTADKVLPAILAGADDVNRKFAEMPVTMERAGRSLSVAWDHFLARLDKSIKLSERLTKLFVGLSKVLEENSFAQLAGKIGAVFTDLGKMIMKTFTIVGKTIQIKLLEAFQGVQNQLANTKFGQFLGIDRANGDQLADLRRERRQAAQEALAASHRIQDAAKRAHDKLFGGDDKKADAGGGAKRKQPRNTNDTVERIRDSLMRRESGRQTEQSKKIAALAKKFGVSEDQIKKIFPKLRGDDPKKRKRADRISKGLPFGGFDPFARHGPQDERRKSLADIEAARRIFQHNVKGGQGNFGKQAKGVRGAVNPNAVRIQTKKDKARAAKVAAAAAKKAQDPAVITNQKLDVIGQKLDNLAFQT